MSEQQRYSISRPLSPPMPSYEPLSASSTSASASTSSAPTRPGNHISVKRESWRPGQVSSTNNIPTGPSSNYNHNRNQNAWKEPSPSSSSTTPAQRGQNARYLAPTQPRHSAQPGENPSNTDHHGSGSGTTKERERDSSRSPVSRRDGSPTSSRDYDREDVDRRRDYDRSREFDRDRDRNNPNSNSNNNNNNWKRDKKRKSFNNNGGGGGNFSNNNNNNGGQGERSWAAWNQKVQNTNNPNSSSNSSNNNQSNDYERDRDRRRDFDRRRDRSRDRDRDRDRDRRRSPTKNGKEKDDEGNGRSWAAWKAKVEDSTSRRENERDRDYGRKRSFDNGRSLENARKEGFWTGTEGHRPPPPTGPSSTRDDDRRTRRDSPDYGAGSGTRGAPRAGGRGGRESPDYGIGGKDQDRSRPSSPQLNDRKRAPTSPQSNEPKRLRDASPTRSRRDSPSPPPSDRWGRRGRRSPSRERSRSRTRSRSRSRSPPPPPRIRPPSPAQPTSASKRAPLPPQGQIFMHGGPAQSNGRQAWGRNREEQMPIQRDTSGNAFNRKWGRDDRMDIDNDSQKDRYPPSELASPSQRNGNGNLGGHHNSSTPKQSHVSAFSPRQAQSIPFTHPSKPPPPPSDTLPYGSPQLPYQSFTPTIPPTTSDINGGGSHGGPSGPIKIAFNASPVKGWKSISPSKTIQNLFDGPSSPDRSQLQSQTNQELNVNSMNANQRSYLKTSPTKDHPDVYLDRIAASERQYTAHLSSIAPYIQAAFTQWFAQNTTPPLQDFLIHYFGRGPSTTELDQIERLLEMRKKTERETSEWRGLHQRAVGGNLDITQHRNGGPASNNSNGIGSVNSIPVIQSRWTPSSSTHKPVIENDGENARTSAYVPRQQQLESININSLPSSSQHQYQISTQQKHERGTPAQSAHTIHPDHPLPPHRSNPPTPTPTPTQPQPQHQHQHQQIDSPHSSSNNAPLSDTSFKATHSGEMYQLVSHVGEGTYGKVYKARNSDTGQMVALKKIRLEGEKDGFPVTAMREIKLLQGVKQANVIRLLEIMVSKGSVHMVFEYMDHDLTGLLSHPTLTFTPGNIKSLSHQMLSGLAYLHDRGILHRDMKGSNILLNSAGELKLADFGLARIYSKRHRDDYTNRVITLWYRSPELLMGETVYGPEVDMWSAGCIVLEIFVTKPIFQGSDEINQLEVIYSIMGSPKESIWPGVKNLPWYELVKPKEAIESRFKFSFEKWLSPAALVLVEGLLHFDPSKRLSAKEAMSTSYFMTEEPPMEMPTQLAGMGEHHEMSAKQERQRRRQLEGR
ncbi:uncharacterized protein IL334_007368 [Kwoniella shivajii]|uniref:Protein kinase domain-containing protein n=1 Tax=Kwoniella shivajii TaxID=564305 RepID=A0ABZ1DAM0_9TREE|nr:hypothetical protein IL334_007368 [Kwoniella shivajii]